MKKLICCLLIFTIVITSSVMTFAKTKGDVNSDGKLNSSDALAILQYSVGSNPKKFNKNVADMNNDSKINSSDALSVLKISVGLVDGDTNTPKTTLRDEVIASVIKDKKFTLSMTVISEGEEIPTTVTMDGNNFAAALSLDGMDSKIITKGGKTYIALDYLGTKMYMETDDDMGVGDFINTESDKDTYVKTTTVKEGSKTYTCEEYKSTDGTVTKYYFEGKKWVRQEVIDGSTISISKIHELKDSVDRSLFDLTGYEELDPGALGPMYM